MVTLSLRGLKLAVAALAVFAIAACAKTDQTAGIGAGGAGGAATPGSARDFAVNVGDRVFFDSDSTDLTPTAVATLDKQAAWLARYPRYTFLVEGHADERGTREYNFSLGARRSQVVRDYLHRAGSRARACAACPTARSGRSRSATTSRAGRRTAAP